MEGQRIDVRSQGAHIPRAILALLMLTATLTLTPGAGVHAADRQIEMNAREAFAAGRFDEALGLFAKLYAETLHPVYLRNIGRCHQKMRQPQKAIDSFGDYLAKAKKVPPAERAEIEGYIKEMEALRAEQASAAAPPVAPPPTSTSPAPGPPPVTTTTPTTTPATDLAPSEPPAGSSTAPGASLTTGPGEPAAPSSPVYTRWWFWTGVGVVIAGGVVAALLLSGGTERPDCSAVTCM